MSRGANRFAVCTFYFKIRFSMRNSIFGKPSTIFIKNYVLKGRQQIEFEFLRNFREISEGELDTKHVTF